MALASWYRRDEVIQGKSALRKSIPNQAWTRLLLDKAPRSIGHLMLVWELVDLPASASLQWNAAINVYTEAPCNCVFFEEDKLGLFYYIGNVSFSGMK